MHHRCVSCLLDYLKLKLDSKSRLPITEFSGYRCMIIQLRGLDWLGSRALGFKTFLTIFSPLEVRDKSKISNKQYRIEFDINLSLFLFFANTPFI